MRLKIKNLLITIIPSLIVIGMIIGLIYLLIDNTRLEFVNFMTEYRIEQKEKDINTAKQEIRDLKGDLVEWQNTANGYKFQLDLINKDNGWSEDE
ncbi:hypothetical protein CAT7_04989 [Carnobacterium sp. AT7]|uniref:hypothetical protein n=1 Tax=Carnobacterium sp. AT7 TaxID=333990 RepID=UPI00015F19C3|nr:hypothetical protein [Carnobacterium sp. AT7]EDP68594.1 hypothetical protein CAT7_04989 [Carnobacterium sp. AT7]